VIAKFSGILVGIALTWASAATGLFLLHELGGYGCCTVSKVRIARMKAREFEQALARFGIDNDRCPSGNDELIRGRYVTLAGLVDPWGMPLAFACSKDGESKVRSAGPDRTFDTADDVTVPD
jgi:hypothetical protein